MAWKAVIGPSECAIIEIALQKLCSAKNILSFAQLTQIIPSPSGTDIVKDKINYDDVMATSSQYFFNENFFQKALP